MNISKISQKILIAEDDLHIGIGLEELFQGEGFQVQRIVSGDKVLEGVDQYLPDLLILDVMLPEMDGIAICRELRKRQSKLLVLMLTAKGEELDKVRGLDTGADDYMTKPFGVRELLARVQALLRRSGYATNESGNEAVDEMGFRIGEACVDSKTYELTREGSVMELSAKELKLLQYFHKHRGEVLSRDQLLNEVWGYNYFGNTRTLDQVVVKLRRLIGEPEGKPKFIKTIHGAGYKLVSHPESE
ncbi:response regulator transcription factor [bacterium]|nr:response regulator transcription factor [bacterium]